MRIGIRDGKNSDLGFGINIPDPQHCYSKCQLASLFRGPWAWNAIPRARDDVIIPTRPMQARAPFWIFQSQDYTSYFLHFKKLLDICIIFLMQFVPHCPFFYFLNSENKATATQLFWIQAHFCIYRTIMTDALLVTQCFLSGWWRSTCTRSWPASWTAGGTSSFLTPGTCSLLTAKSCSYAVTKSKKKSDFLTSVKRGVASTWGTALILKPIRIGIDTMPIHNTAKITV